MELKDVPKPSEYFLLQKSFLEIKGHSSMKYVYYISADISLL